jgi:hypothetical protein
MKGLRENCVRTSHQILSINTTVEMFAASSTSSRLLTYFIGGFAREKPQPRLQDGRNSNEVLRYS